MKISSEFRVHSSWKNPIDVSVRYELRTIDYELFLMPEEGIEPTRLHKSRQILSLLRLPVSPLRRLLKLYTKK